MKKFNGFENEAQYLEALEMFKDIQENNDTYDRDTIAVYKEDDYVELVIDDYSIRIWGEFNLEVYFLKEGEHLVDNGIMNVCWNILERIKDGEMEDLF